MSRPALPGRLFCPTHLRWYHTKYKIAAGTLLVLQCRCCRADVDESIDVPVAHSQKKKDLAAERRRQMNEMSMQLALMEEET